MGLSERIPFRVNTHFLAGFSRALGIEIGEREIRVVEVERAGLVTPKQSEPVELIWSYTIRVEGENGTEEIASKLKNLFEAMCTDTRRASLSLRPQALRLVSAEVPDGVHSIPEWIEENSDRLLQLPISLSELSYDYRFLPTGQHEGKSVEIAFVRRAEIERCMEICRSVALEPVYLGVAVDSASKLPPNPVYTCHPFRFKVATQSGG